MPALRICALYPELMNIYADRGNLLLLERRCAWRGIGYEVSAASLGDEIVLSRTTAEEIEALAPRHGLRVLPRRQIAETEDYVGSEVVMLCRR